MVSCTLYDTIMYRPRYNDFYPYLENLVASSKKCGNGKLGSGAICTVISNAMDKWHLALALTIGSEGCCTLWILLQTQEGRKLSALRWPLLTRVSYSFMAMKRAVGEPKAKKWSICGSKRQP